MLEQPGADMRPVIQRMLACGLKLEQEAPALNEPWAFTVFARSADVQNAS